jgi:putative hydrolase of the HAD superfamily
MHQKPRGILFDLGGTLLTLHPFDVATAAVKLASLAESTTPVPSSDLAWFVRALDQEFSRRADDAWIEVRAVDFLRLIAARFGLQFRQTLDVLELELWKAAMRMEREPGVLDMLEGIGSLGIPVGIVSNSAFSAAVLEFEVNRHGLDTRRFRFLMSSADYGFRKPHPILMSTAVARLGLAPSEVWYVGDIPKYDVAGARAAGLQAIWYNPRGEEQPDAENLVPHAQIRSWSEFLPLVKNRLETEST